MEDVVKKKKKKKKIPPEIVKGKKNAPIAVKEKKITLNSNFLLPPGNLMVRPLWRNLHVCSCVG